MKTRNKIQVLGDNLFALCTGHYNPDTTDLNLLWDITIKRILQTNTKGAIKKYSYPPLSVSQIREAREFYKPYAGFDTTYHRAYAAQTGVFRPEYIPDDIYYNNIERYYTDRDAADYLDNKCLYYRFFYGIPQASPITMRIGSSWLDKDYNLISYSRALELIDEAPSAVAKIAVNSEGGYGVIFLEGNNKSSEFDNFVKNVDYDIVVQHTIKQHADTAKLHPSSVNTYRIMSLLTQDGVKILATAARIGVGNTKTDNLCSGGFFVGVNDDGTLKKTGWGLNGLSFEKHPDLGYTLEGTRVPSVQKAKELVKRAHGVMAHCRLASWDVAIDENGEAMLIETNLCLGLVNSIQVCCGPIFGEDTKKVLDEVFFDEKGRKRRHFDTRAYTKKRLWFRDNLKGIIAGSYSSSDTRPTLLTNAALRHIDIKAIRKDIKPFPRLNRDQIRSIREFFKPYKKNVQTLSHRLYTGSGGKFHVDYIPEDMYLCDISRYLCDRDLSYHLENKCYYPRLFAGVKQPATLCMRINGIWLDKDYKPEHFGSILKRLAKEPSVVIKAASHSEGGAGVSILKFSAGDDTASRESLIKKHLPKRYDTDIIIQSAVEQSEETAKLHPRSLNTFRIVSLIIDDKVEILSRCIKTGVGDSLTDNGSTGGIYIGVSADGSLSAIGIQLDYSAVTAHPDTGISFADVVIPGVKKCEELVKKAHPVLSHNRLVAWDVALDSSGDAVLIEANMCFGTSDTVQILNGPLFGSYTTRILSEVYQHKKHKK